MLSDHLDQVRLATHPGTCRKTGGEPAKEFEAGHIPGAIFFDIDAIVTSNLPAPHDAYGDEFSRAIGALALAMARPVVVYDGGWDLFPRASLVDVQSHGPQPGQGPDGGPTQMEHEARPWKQDPPGPRPRFSQPPKTSAGARLRRGDGIVKDKTAQIVDARGAGRFTGAEPEPRAGCAAAICREQQMCTIAC